MNEQESTTPVPRRSWRRWAAVTSAFGFGIWWIGSILLHTALFGFLAIVAPQKPTAATSSEEFTMTISPERVEEVVEEIRTRKSEEFQEQVQELMDIKKELAEVNVAKVQQYNELMKSEAALAPDAIKKATQEALAAQDEAIHAQDQAKATLGKIAEAQAAISAPAPVLAAASTGTDAAPVAVPTPAPDDQSAAKAGEETAKAELENAQKAIASSQSKVAAAQVRIEQQLFGNAQSGGVNRENVDLQNQASLLQKDASAAAKAIDQLRAREITLHAKALADKAKVAAEQKHQADEEAKIAALQAATPTKSQELTQLLAKQPKSKLSVERAAQIVVDDTRKIEEISPAIKAAIEQAQKLEEQAQQAQSKAKEALARTADQLAKALESPPVPVPVPATQDANPTLTKDLAGLYEQALQTENGLTQTFKQVRAAELAAIRKLPMDEALALTEVAKPVRNQFDTKIMSKDIRDVQGVRAQEQAINTASAELTSMVSLARRMKELAMPDTTANVTIAELKGQASHSDKMEQLALQSEGARAKDLSGEMGDGQSGEHEAAGQGNGPADAKGEKGSEPPGYLFASIKEMQPVPGRTLRGEMQDVIPKGKGTWMFVDSWYLIGPWPNPGRKNLNTKFPPETVLDLNATYTGGKQDGRPIPVGWHFFQAPAVAARRFDWEPIRSGQIIPPGLGEYEIYYAYTELWSDEARNLWVAIGSDDQSKIWLNDDMIWKSSDEQKVWEPNEGLRKVHFRKGINRILYRYENGHYTGCFSFFISLKTSSDAPVPESPH